MIIAAKRVMASIRCLGRLVFVACCACIANSFDHHSSIRLLSNDRSSIIRHKASVRKESSLIGNDSRFRGKALLCSAHSSLLSGIKRITITLAAICMASVPLPTNAKEKRASPFEDKIYELVAESLSGDASSYQSGQMKLSLRTENVDPVFFVNRHRQEISSAAVVVGSGITLTAGAVLSGRALMLKIKPASRRNLVSEGNETSNGSMESWSKDHELPQLERKDLTASYSSRLTDAKDSGETAQLRAGSQLSLGYASAVEQVLVAASHNNSEWLPMADSSPSVPHSLFSLTI